MEQVLSLIANSAALAGKPGDLLQYGYWLGTRGDSEAIRIKYMIEIIADEMGDERSNPQERRTQLLELVEDQSVATEVMQAAEDEAAAMLIEMEKTRQEVFGLPLSRLKEMR